MTSLQLFVVAGMLVAAGIGTFLWWLTPVQLDLGDALNRLAPRRASTTATQTVAAGDVGERAGLWAIRRLPLGWVRVPAADLAVLRKSVASFYGDKLAFAALAAAVVPVLAWLVSWTVQLPVTIPVAVTVTTSRPTRAMPKSRILQRPTSPPGR